MGENKFENSTNNQQHTNDNIYSDIRYTYNPNGSNEDNTYNTNISKNKKKNLNLGGNGCFITLIAVLLCITVAAAAISLFSIFNNGEKNNDPSSTADANILSTPTPELQGSSDKGFAFGSVVTVKPTPTPQLIDGEILTPQQAAEKVIPSVVCIQCYTTNNYFGGTSSSSLYSEGSGIISRSDGYIITNAHVIDNASSVQVVLYNGITLDAQIIGSDSITDLALLKINPGNYNLQAATFSSATNCNIADNVLAVGNPGGLEFSSSVTSGIISALNRAVQDEKTGYVMHCIQTDTAINPGNSGGPLIDLYGNVIGITSSKIVAEGYENMGFAITYDEAAPIINDLLNYGHVKNRAAINITLALPSNVFRVTGWNSIPKGLCVTAISGKNEEDAGLKQYDIIYAIDDKQISTMSDYSSYLLTKKPGEKVKLTVYRATISGWSVEYSQKPITIEIVLSEAT
ncbi:MAG: trypsin-like serine protease [Clostridiales bacterium]|nr:trypsin-like serine protease [Clostridiales bacterium]